jgi:carbon-monoxide dehydrogenase large subunit
MDYAMPRADAMPTPTVETLTVPSTSNPLGAKGAGEAGVAGALTAVVNAVHDAMGEALPAGRTRLPLTPARLWAALAG